MRVLSKNDDNIGLMPWVNLDFLPDSKAERVEIYLKEPESVVKELIVLFWELFEKYSKDIFIHNGDWWEFCLDVWNVTNDVYDFDRDKLSFETNRYIIMLENSDIEIGYSMDCLCNDFNEFLSTVLPCVVNHIAPYSPIFYNRRDDFFFYFHHTGSVGIYFKQRNNNINNLIIKAESLYEVVYNK